MSDSTPDFAPEISEIESKISGESSCANSNPQSSLESTLQELVSRQQRWENTQVQWVERQLEWTERLVTHVVALEEMLGNRNTPVDTQQYSTPFSQAVSSSNTEELERLRRELTEKNEEVEFYKARAVGNSAIEEDKQRIEELEKRLDLAIGELRETKSQLAKSEAELAIKAAAPVAPAPHAATPTPEKFANWEAQKKFLLNELNGEAGESISPNDRITVQQVIAATDRAIKEKEEEIKELQTLLQFRNENVTEVVVGAAAIDEILNNDEIIQQEREQLERLKKEWKDKVRTAEIEISMERAKLAREKNELEQQIEWLKVEKENVDSQSKQNSKQNKSKWFSRLGLNE